jgi:glycosyltransferase involved in cell wall biosynthesis
MDEVNTKVPKLSVISINLNNASGLEDTIRSILDQSFADFELIVIDGGSTDHSIDVIKKYSFRIKYWISESDNGIYHAMNKGIEKAGEYCHFLNSGDYLSDGQVFEKVFKVNPCEDVLFGNLYVTMHGKLTGKAYGKEDLSFSDVYAHTIKHQASFIKRSLFDRFGKYNVSRKIVADWEFFIKTVGLGNVSYRYIDLFVSYFDNDGFSNHNAEITKSEREEIIMECIPLMMQPDYEFLLRYRGYESIYQKKISFFLLRLLNKIKL